MCGHLACVSTVIECLPPDCELQYPVRPLDEDERLLPAAVQGRPVYVDELVADLQLLAQGRLPAILDLETKTPIGWDERKESWTANRSTLRLTTRRTSGGNKKVTHGRFNSAKPTPFKNPFLEAFFVRLSASTWQRRPEEHLQNRAKHTSHRKPITFLCKRLCVCLPQRRPRGRTVVLLMHRWDVSARCSGAGERASQCGAKGGARVQP